MGKPISSGQAAVRAASLGSSKMQSVKHPAPRTQHEHPAPRTQHAAPSTEHPAPALGLYLHVPFCSAICNYCNFNRGLFDADVKRKYVDALIQEVRGATHGLRSAKVLADTIYFGGGTPSLLEPEEVQSVIEACCEAFDVAADREVTLEANPESVTEERLRGYRAAGVNRISFGVQSFRDDELRRLSRLHDSARARTAFDEARRAGFENVSLDLMMWLPGQHVGEWLDSVGAAAALAPEHLSLYLLEVYPNAPLKDEMARARCSQAPDEDAATMYLEAMELLDNAGYEQYEISNVARSGRQSRHNVKYWSDGNWLGFGCGAHSTLNGARWKNLSSTQDYIDHVSRGLSAATDTRSLSPAERLGDALFMGLRLTAGVSLDVFRVRYGVDIWRRYGDALAAFIQDGCLQKQGDRLWLTRRGMLLANEVMAVFV
jgi:oxygen-independent coproporphyrinogen III oxidase